MALEELVATAREASKNAHAPYSEYQVGAAVETASGRVYGGCNVENASFGLTICAERFAVGAAVAAGDAKIVRIVVVTDGDPPAAPCGACRQFLREFGSEIEVVAVGPQSTRSWKLSELIPEGFSPEDLDR